ncbi:MAG: YhcH/YjgK/YiaL family protein [Ruthenibacterium sp.]
MIYIERTEIAQYYGISKNLDIALRYLQAHDFKTLMQGRNEVDGDAVYINRFDYTTMPEKDAFYEAHEQYADIHVLLSGEEKILVANTETLTETGRDAASDFIGYKGDAEAVFNMQPQKILIVFPNEAHMVKVQLHAASAVQKAVMKVKI